MISLPSLEEAKEIEAMAMLLGATWQGRYFVKQTPCTPPLRGFTLTYFNRDGFEIPYEEIGNKVTI